jgi:hypothetical protein
MRDEELRRRIEAVAEHGERAVSPPDPAVLYRRARRRVARLTAVGVLVAGALLAGGLFARAGLPGEDRFPAVTVPPSPPSTAVPPTTAPPTTSASTTTQPQAAPARFPVAPPMIGDAETSVPMARLVTRSSGWALTRTRLAWTGDGGATWTRLPQPPDVQRGVLSSPTRGWAVVMGQAAATSGPDRGPAGLYTTTDAGQTWRRMGLLPPPSLRGTRIELREPPTFKTRATGSCPSSSGPGEAARRARSRWASTSPPTAVRPGRPGTCRWPPRTSGTARSCWPPAASASCWPWSATRPGRS